MYFFVFDTETTGLFNKVNPSLDAQPRITQFAGIYGKIESNNTITKLETVDIMINPTIPIPFEASQINHIYDIDVKDAPKLPEVLDTVLKYINEPDIIIGHNIEYDQEVIRIELKRLGKEYLYKPKSTFCTMRETVDICKIELASGRFKNPRLSELHKFLFGEYFVGAHNALVDVEATLRCFEKLLKDGNITLKQKEQEVLSLF